MTQEDYEELDRIIREVEAEDRRPVIGPGPLTSPQQRNYSLRFSLSLPSPSEESVSSILAPHRLLSMA